MADAKSQESEEHGKVANGICRAYFDSLNFLQRWHDCLSDPRTLSTLSNMVHQTKTQQATAPPSCLIS